MPRILYQYCFKSVWIVSCLFYRVGTGCKDAEMVHVKHMLDVSINYELNP